MAIDRKKPWIVCAACKSESLQLVATGARHFDNTMRDMINALGRADNGGTIDDTTMLLYWRTHWSSAEQGFIDQRGQFYTREEAWVIAEANGQIRETTGAKGTLFSEDLY